jgi:hypothetical protein
VCRTFANIGLSIFSRRSLLLTECQFGSIIVSSSKIDPLESREAWRDDGEDAKLADASISGLSNGFDKWTPGLEGANSVTGRW